MDHSELKILREKLGFNQENAANLIGQTTLEYWILLEEGQRGIPAKIVQTIHSLEQYYDESLGDYERLVTIFKNEKEPLEKILICHYTTMQDWLCRPDHEEIYFPTYLKVIDTIRKKYPEISVNKFVYKDYLLWLNDREDCKKNRLEFNEFVHNNRHM